MCHVSVNSYPVILFLTLFFYKCTCQEIEMLFFTWQSLSYDDSLMEAVMWCCSFWSIDVFCLGKNDLRNTWVVSVHVLFTYFPIIFVFCRYVLLFHQIKKEAINPNDSSTHQMKETVMIEENLCETYVHI